MIEILSVITNEFLENFGNDDEDLGNGKFGGNHAQEQIFGTSRPNSGKDALKYLKENNPDIIPKVD